MLPIEELLVKVTLTGSVHELRFSVKSTVGISFTVISKGVSPLEGFDVVRFVASVTKKLML